MGAFCRLRRAAIGSSAIDATGDIDPITDIPEDGHASTFSVTET